MLEEIPVEGAVGGHQDRPVVRAHERIECGGLVGIFDAIHASRRNVDGRSCGVSTDVFDVEEAAGADGGGGGKIDNLVCVQCIHKQACRCEGEVDGGHVSSSLKRALSLSSNNKPMKNLYVIRLQNHLHELQKQSHLLDLLR